MISFDDWYSKNLNRLIEELLEYIRIDTSSPNEKESWFFLLNSLQKRHFEVEKRYINPEIWLHPNHCTSLFSTISDKSFNIVGELKNNSSETVLINCHIDVVPGSSLFPESFNPVVRENAVYGRGACDTKANFIMLVGALDYLNDIGMMPSNNILLHMPLEEEIGGNGTLSLALDGIQDVKYAVVLEPTNFEIFRGHRGCVTFNIKIVGESIHMGESQAALSAIDIAIKVIEQLKQFEKELIQEAKQYSAFSKWTKPLQLNIGTIKGGEWHGSVPQKCSISGNLGFLPNYSIAEISSTLSKRIMDVSYKTGVNITVSFDALKNDAYLIHEDEDVVKDLINALNKSGIDQKDCFAWHVSCDARTYVKECNIPTVIFGCGLLTDAHSNHEKIAISDLGVGIKILADFLIS